MRTIIIFSLLISYITSVFFKVPVKKSECITKYFNEKKKIKFSYYIVGFINEKYTAILYSGYNREKIELRSSDDNENNEKIIDVERDRPYTFCIYNNDNVMMASNAYFENEEEENKEEVLVDNIENLNYAITQITKSINKIDKNIKNGAGNREQHSIVAHSIRKRIMIFTTVKIIFLIVFSFFQIMMITSVLQGVKVVKTIEMNQRGSKFGDKEFL